MAVKERIFLGLVTLFFLVIFILVVSVQNPTSTVQIDKYEIQPSKSGTLHFMGIGDFGELRDGN
jgi:hypothetical protein